MNSAVVWNSAELQNVERRQIVRHRSDRLWNIVLTISFHLALLPKLIVDRPPHCCLRSAEPIAKFRLILPPFLLLSPPLSGLSLPSFSYMTSTEFWDFFCPSPHSVLTNFRVRTCDSQGNQMHSGILWTLGIPKMYMRTLGYNVQIPL